MKYLGLERTLKALALELFSAFVNAYMNQCVLGAKCYCESIAKHYFLYCRWYMSCVCLFSRSGFVSVNTKYACLRFRTKSSHGQYCKCTGSVLVTEY
ncbi:hypothetical protein Plhal304r1_c001g0002571 [Plasmopara halstedii]